MVVISVISLLSSIILAAINQARIKALNSAAIERVRQYRNALELYARRPQRILPGSERPRSRQHGLFGNLYEHLWPW